MDAIDKVMNVFISDNYQSILQRKRIEIEKILKEYVEKSNNKVSKEINSRIKGENSLREKLTRKDYVNKWQIENDDDLDIQTKICENLPDLIGFRINCYFKKDEENIFNNLIYFLKQNKNIKVEESPNTIQKNGHVIYKIACKYTEVKNIFSFEVQVKSLLNDAWGEVEHSIIYKNKIYDSRKVLKEEIVEGLYDILDGADRQLNNLYSFNADTKEIKNELFYKFASESLRDEMILGEDYSVFFTLTQYIDFSTERIDEYLGRKLLKEEYTKKTINSNEQIIGFEKYKKEFDEFKVDKLSKIVKLLFEFESKDDLLVHLIKQVHHKATDPEEEITEDDIFATTINTLSCLTRDNERRA